MTHVENPPPRIVAAAISDLAAHVVRDAWQYLDDWEALASAGVPRATIRECLADPLDTEPLCQLVGWVEAGEAGLLCLRGVPGTGKTYAEGRWVLGRHRRGQYTHWLAGAALPMLDLRSREARLAAVADVGALVFDDLGTGAGQGDYLRDQIRGLLQHRIDSLRPTVIASNAALTEIEGWLGARLVDRFTVAGGTVDVRSRTSLRAEATVKLDGLGRGPECYRARRIVDIVGCERREQFDENGQRLPDRLHVGDTLHKEANRRGLEATDHARDLLQLSSDAVMAKARELAAVEARLCEWAAGTLEVRTAAMSISFEGVAAATAAKLRAQRERQEQESSNEAAAIVQRAKQRLEAGLGCDVDLGSFQHVEPPAWALGKEGRRKLAALGFRVRGSHGGYRVLREREGRTTPIADRCESEDQAWYVAALVCAEIDTSPAGDAGLHEIESAPRAAHRCDAQARPGLSLSVPGATL